MILAITGSRNLNVNIDEFMPPPDEIEKFISGGAKGIDQIGEDWAARNGIPTEVIRPDYEHNPYRAAPLIRNREIVNKADAVIAFWDGKSRGTKYTIDYAIKQGKKVKVFTFEEE